MVQQKESSFLQDVFTKLQNAKSNDYSIKTRAENLETLQDAFRSNPFRHLLEIYYEKIKKELSILIDDPFCDFSKIRFCDFYKFFRKNLTKIAKF
ncbi:hypothetical protein MHBO_002739 [Bonamia ostreae]|uniref:Uncharacterized protein n=1 Tax=Bonamia ostreae TaxID=126728 RepID=A0ABV2ANF0_9EUKA